MSGGPKERDVQGPTHVKSHSRFSFLPRIVPGASGCQRNLRFPWDIFRMIEAMAFGVQDGDFAGSANDEGCVLALAKK